MSTMPRMSTILICEAEENLRWFLGSVATSVVVPGYFKLAFPERLAARIAERSPDTWLAVAYPDALQAVTSQRVDPGGAVVFHGDRPVWAEPPIPTDSKGLLLEMMAMVSDPNYRTKKEDLRDAQVLAWLAVAAGDGGREPAAQPGTVEEDLYQILGIAPGVSKAEGKAAFKKRVKEYHPDNVERLGRKLRELAEEETKRIVAAWSALEGRLGG